MLHSIIIEELEQKFPEILLLTHLVLLKQCHHHPAFLAQDIFFRSQDDNCVYCFFSFIGLLRCKYDGRKQTTRYISLTFEREGRKDPLLHKNEKQQYYVILNYH